MRKFRWAAIVALLLGGIAFAGAPATAEPAGAAPNALRGLFTWWHSARADHYASGTAVRDNDALNVGYTFLRNEGYLQTTNVSGTVPLYLYWHSGRMDNLTTATATGISDAVASGYTFARIEGYVFPA
ncbi:hypothetical protein Q5530_02095 [Saccharothrix sp. BKS2]|uniref:hypothetical protein n=1 Tax=Saccharothrix sp. BKS2 TaxID=3064400 RepID=UPI0039EBDC07